ncbi:MAG: glycosyltransferase family 9 protein [Candidatus Omnitrophica bacterium]|nr:glycosyltransferase family 9 protein [Candidatus Omnitrophota bacterium]
MRYVFKNKILCATCAIIDAMGEVCTFLPRKLKRPLLPSEIKTILVVRLDHIGDVLYATSVPALLKGRFPNARIVFLVGSWAKEIVSGNPYIDETLVFDAPWFNRKSLRAFSMRSFFNLAKRLKSYHFDLGLDLRGDCRHIFLMTLGKVAFRIGFGITGGRFLLHHCVSYDAALRPSERNIQLLSVLGIQALKAEPVLYSQPSNVSEAKAFLKKHQLDANGIAIMHPCAGTSVKNWRDARFAALADRLAKEFLLKVMFVGASEDKGRIDSIVQMCAIKPLNAAGEFSLKTLVEVLKAARLFVGIDSGPGHLASCVGIPTVLLYSGTNTSDAWAPQGKRTVVVEKQISCKACERAECLDTICMDLISVNDVIGAVRQVWQKA